MNRIKLIFLYSLVFTKFELYSFQNVSLIQKFSNKDYLIILKLTFSLRKFLRCSKDRAEDYSSFYDFELNYSVAT